MTAFFRQEDQTGSPCSSHEPQKNDIFPGRRIKPAALAAVMNHRKNDLCDCCADYVPTLGETHTASFGLWAHYIKLKGSSSTWASRYYAADRLYQCALMLRTSVILRRILGRSS